MLALAPAAQADPTASFTAPSSPYKGQPATFDASSSQPSSGNQITWYFWNFGDGSSTLPAQYPTKTVTHTYSQGGVYNVTLTVVQSDGTTSQAVQQVGVIAPPNAAFNPTSASIIAGSPLTFDGTQSSDPYGSITAYSWNFGDGSGSTAAQPTHTFTQPGTYNVTLTVSESHGEFSSVTHQITVTAPSPIQTLVEAVIPAPILIKFGSPTLVGHALVDLKQRLFCPGSGPVCRTTITETKTGLARDRKVARAAAGAVLTTRDNGNAELALRLTSAQWNTLVKNHHLSLSLRLIATRGAEKVTTTLRLKLRH